MSLGVCTAVDICSTAEWFSLAQEDSDGMAMQVEIGAPELLVGP